VGIAMAAGAVLKSTCGRLMDGGLNQPTIELSPWTVEPWPRARD
jgi:hypothetical protein